MPFDLFVATVAHVLLEQIGDGDGDTDDEGGGEQASGPPMQCSDFNETKCPLSRCNVTIE
jgi:hypothetical protein